ncbi:MAG: acyltransferase family protein [Actinomycetota bacterium]
MATTASPGRHGFAYQPALDGLRAVAVIAVILYHLDLEWMSGGFLGVDTFFVLSGYLITSLLLVEYETTGTVSLRDFWVRRAKRLLPAALLLLLVVAVYSWAVAPTDRLGTIRGDSLATLAYVANWRFILDDASYFELWSEASPLRHMWSLAIEEQFYVLWPLIVLGLLRAGRGRPTALTISCLLGTAGSVVLMAVLADVDRSRAYFGTDTRAHTILVGALLAILLRRAPTPSATATRAVHAAGAAAIVLVGVAFVIVDDADIAFYRGGSLAFSVLVAVVITAGVSNHSSLVASLLDRSALRWIGQISYGLYLWHWPMIVWLTPERVGTDGFGLDTIRVVATFACTIVSYRMVEQPIRHRRTRPSRVARVVPAAMAITAVAVVAGTAGATTNPLDQEADFEIAVATPTTTAAPTTTATPESTPDATADDAIATTSTTIPERVESIALIGDSVAGSLAPAMSEALTGAGYVFLDAHVHGCGVASGLTVTETGERFPWSEECVERVPTVHERLVDDHDPDLIVWHSTWETADRLIGDTFLEFGTGPHDAALAEEIDTVMRRLTRRGARVVILVAPPNAPSAFLAEPDPTDMLHLATQLEAAAMRFDELSLIDLNPIVCPGGPPCPEQVDDLTLRPDGGHYSNDAAVWLVAELLDDLASS